MKKQSTYVFLPTEKEIESGDLVKLPNGKLQIMSENDMIDYLDSQSSATKPQNLYILSEDEPQVDDWCYGMDGLFQYKGKVNIDGGKLPSKIIATTDPELWDNGFPVPTETGIGKITPSDIEYIISLHNGGGKGVDVRDSANRLSNITKKLHNRTDEYCEGARDGFILGYNQCLTDNADKIFTLDDARIIFANGGGIIVERSLGKNVTLEQRFNDTIQSLTKSHSRRDTIMVEYEPSPTKNWQYELKLQGGCIVISRG